MTQVRFLPLRSVAFPALGILLLLTGAGCRGPSPYANPALSATSAPRPVAMKGEGRFFDGQIVATLSISRGFERGGRGGKNGVQYDTIDLPDPSDKDYAESIGKIMALQVPGSPLSPVTLRLSLANPTAQPLVVEIAEFNSDLGNFAVQPDKLTLAPGQSAEPDQMNSKLGVTADEIPVKVALRCGGRMETQIVVVKNLFTADGKRK